MRLSATATTGNTTPFRICTARPATPWREFSVRRHTALYRLRSPATRVAQVLHAIAEGLSAQAAARVFNLSEGTVRSWLARASLHSRSLHGSDQRCMGCSTRSSP
jgi:DNA-directed RNA polymerase specialized sigma24 family protein